MAWKDNLLDAAFRGVFFDCRSTDDSADHALVRHEYPYVDGADVESMGRTARTVSVEAVFYDDEAHPAADSYEKRLKAFEAALNGADSQLSAEDAAKGGWLQHPVFGMMFVQVGRYQVHHEADQVDEARVSVEFVESTPSAPFFSQELATQKADAANQHGGEAVSSVSDKAAKVIGAIQAANPLNGLDRLRQAVMGPLLDITAGVGLVLSGLDPLQYPRAWANDVAGLAGNLLDVRDWTRDARAQWPSILSDFKSFSLLGAPSATSTPQLSPSLAPTEDQGLAVAAAAIAVVVQTTIAQGAATLLASEMGTPTMTPDEVEAMADTVRASLEATIGQVRAIFSQEDAGPVIDALKSQALALQDAAAAVIAARPPLVDRAIAVPGNFRLQAFLWYGDAARGDELYLLNGARSPFTLPGDLVHAYAN